MSAPYLHRFPDPGHLKLSPFIKLIKMLRSVLRGVGNVKPLEDLAARMAALKSKLAPHLPLLPLISRQEAGAAEGTHYGGKTANSG